MADYITIPANPKAINPIGATGENEVTALVFDASDWVEHFGDEGVFELWHKRPTDTEYYPCVVEQDGAKVTWVIRSADLAHEGIGFANLTYTIGNRLAKSLVYNTFTRESATGAGSVSPEWASWVEQVIAAGAQAIGGASEAAESAASALASATTASEAAEESVASKQAAEAAKEVAVSAQTSATASAQAAAESESNAADSAESASASATTATEKASAAAQSATSASASSSSAMRYSASAEQARIQAEGSAVSANNAKNDAIAAKNAAETSKNSAAQSASSAAISYTDAAAAKIAAEISADDALASQNAAASSATAASAAKTAAETAQASASASAASASADADRAEAAADSVSEAVTDIADLKAKMPLKADKTALAATDRSLSALWALTEGTVWRSETDSTEAYSKVVPSGAKGLSVDGWSGKTVAVNQLMTGGYSSGRVSITRDDDTFTATQTYSGNSGAGNSLAASVDALSILGHKYVVIVDTFAPSSNSTLSSLLIGVRSALTTVPITPDKWEHRVIISTPTEARNLFFISNGSYMVQDESFSWRNVHIADLTQIGWGDITSADDERIKWLDAYLAANPDYDEGSLVSAPVQSVDVQGRNLLNVSTDTLISAEGFAGSVTDVGNGSYRVLRDSLVGFIVPVDPDTDYHFYGVGVNCASGNWRIREYQTIPTSWTDGAIQTFNGGTAAGVSATIKTLPTTHYIICAKYETNVGAIIKDLTLSRGTSGGYTPYIALNSIAIPAAVKALPDYGIGVNGIYNSVERNGDRWEYHKRYAEIVFNGTQTITEENLNETRCRVFIAVDNVSPFVGDSSLVDDSVLSNYLPQASNNNTYSGLIGVHRRVTGAKQICISLGVNSGIHSTEQFNDYLSEHPLTVYYPLATPVETDITDIMAPLGLNALLCEGGGTVTMINEAELAVQSDVEYAVKISEVGA